MADLPKRRPGRPPKSPSGAKRGAITLRIHEKTRTALEQRAAAHGRSFSEEAENLIEQGMLASSLFDQSLDMAYGRRGSGFVLILMKAVASVGAQAGHFLQWKGVPIEDSAWLKNPFVYDQVAAAINEIVAAIRPKGPKNTSENYDMIGRAWAATVLGAIAQNEQGEGFEWMDQIRVRLGPDLLNRIQQFVDDEWIYKPDEAEEERATRPVRRHKAA